MMGSRSPLVLFALVGCAPEHGFTPAGWDADAQAHIEVSPRELFYGPTRTDDTEAQRFTVSNHGDAVLHVDEILVDGASFTLIGNDDDLHITPGETLDFDVVYHPTVGGDAVSIAHVHSSDVNEPHIPVYLTGLAAVPDLVVDPPSYDYGDHLVGCGRSMPLQLTSIGDDPVIVDDIVFDADTTIAMVAPPTFPLSIEPGTTTEIEVEFYPTGIGIAQTDITVISNDPDGPITVHQVGSGLPGPETVDVFEVPLEPPVDLMFAVDRSCSMEDDADAIASGFNVFIDNITETTSDWTASVVTRDNGCVDMHVDPSTPNYAARFSEAVAYHPITPGGWVVYSYTEALLTVSRNAVREAFGGCNAGVFRDGALAHIIVVSDEPDQSPEGWPDLVADMTDTHDMLVVTAVAGDLPDGCATAGPGYGYAEAATATSGGFFSICENWANTLDDLAEATTTLLFRFTLTQKPVPETIVVSVNGDVVTEGWTYDENTNSVGFDTPPPGDSTVSIAYTIKQPCD